jgi:poly(A) polymerase
MNNKKTNVAAGFSLRNGMIIPRSDHPISRKNISHNALKVLYRLHEAGFSAYLVGGSVRDLLVGLRPKDFDIATNALPEEIKTLFSNCRLIGRRFRLAHVHFGREIVEVATFRGAHSADGISDDGLVIRDNNYGSIEEDAWRRDFTVNSLYYNIADFSLVDFTTGMKDIQDKVIRVIGDPVTRYNEDPIRMLRAVRLAAKLNFTIEKNSGEPIKHLTNALLQMSPNRLFDEIVKWFLSGESLRTFHLMQEYGLFQILFPAVNEVLIMYHDEFYPLLAQGFANTDKRIKEQKPINPAFLMAVMLWIPLQIKIDDYIDKQNFSISQAIHTAVAEVVGQQKKIITIPNYLASIIKEIWVLQFKFARSSSSKAQLVLKNPRFKIAYDFLLLRAQVYSDLDELAQEWTKIFEKSVGN